MLDFFFVNLRLLFLSFTEFCNLHSCSFLKESLIRCSLISIKILS